MHDRFFTRIHIVLIGLCLFAVGATACNSSTTSPASLAYTQSSAVYLTDVAISNNIPKDTGGSAKSYVVTPALPTGLSLNPLTGAISGTPTVVTSLATYTVTVTNTNGTSASTKIQIQVNAPAPISLAYSTNPAVYIVNTPITNNTPHSSGGTITSYSVSPSLPAGLSLNTSTGVISGTPTAAAATTVYTVTATEPGSSTTAEVTITVSLPSATVSISTSTTTPLSSGFSGFNTQSTLTPAQYTNSTFQSMTQGLNPGVLRWPGGTVDDFFDWTTGLFGMTPNSNLSGWSMLDVIAASNWGMYNANNPTKNGDILLAKQGNTLSSFAALAQASNSRISIVVNTFSDTVQSAHDLAEYAASNNLPVRVFALGNEAYFFLNPAPAPSPLPSNYPVLPAGAPPSNVPGASFTSAGNYLTLMEPYYNAIKQGWSDGGGNPSEILVAIDGGYITPQPFAVTPADWVAGLQSYVSANGAYWDAVDLHEYPPTAPNTSSGANGSFTDSVPYANNTLAYQTSAMSQIAQQNWALGKTLMVTEYNVSFSNTNITGTWYSGIFAAEYIMRMSAVPDVDHVAMHCLTCGVITSPPDALADTTNANGQAESWTSYLENLGSLGETVNYSQHPVQNLYYSAEGIGTAIANQAVNSSDALYATTISGGPAPVSLVSGTMPALAAQAYRDASDGSTHLLVTNKGATAVTLTIDQNGALATSLVATLAASNDPSVVNQEGAPTISLPSPTSVQNPVIIPAYGVLHVKW